MDKFKGIAITGLFGMAAISAMPLAFVVAGAASICIVTLEEKKVPEKKIVVDERVITKDK
jgi:hypothetical protein